MVFANRAANLDVLGQRRCHLALDRIANDRAPERSCLNIVDN